MNLLLAIAELEVAMENFCTHDLLLPRKVELW